MPPAAHGAATSPRGSMARRAGIRRQSKQLEGGTRSLPSITMAIGVRIKHQGSYSLFTKLRLFYIERFAPGCRHIKGSFFPTLQDSQSPVGDSCLFRTVLATSEANLCSGEQPGPMRVFFRDSPFLSTPTNEMVRRVSAVVVSHPRDREKSRRWGTEFIHLVRW